MSEYDIAHTATDNSDGNRRTMRQHPRLLVIKDRADRSDSHHLCPSARWSIAGSVAFSASARALPGLRRPACAVPASANPFAVLRAPKPQNGVTALHWAADHGAAEAIDELVWLGANVSALSAGVSPHRPHLRSSHLRRPRE